MSLLSWRSESNTDSLFDWLFVVVRKPVVALVEEWTAAIVVGRERLIDLLGVMMKISWLESKWILSVDTPILMMFDL